MLLRLDFRQSKYALAKSSSVKGGMALAALISADGSRSELIVLVVDVLVAILKVLVPRVVGVVLGCFVLSTSSGRLLSRITAQGLFNLLQAAAGSLGCALRWPGGQRHDQILIAQAELP